MGLTDTKQLRHKAKLEDKREQDGMEKKTEDTCFPSFSDRYCSSL